MSGQDARVWAWMQAWDHLEAATKIQEKYPEREIEDAVARLHRAAEIYGHLADVAEDVGEVAAELLVARKRQDEEQREMVRDFMQAHKNGCEAPRDA